MTYLLIFLAGAPLVYISSISAQLRRDGLGHVEPDHGADERAEAGEQQRRVVAPVGVLGVDYRKKHHPESVTGFPFSQLG